MNKSMRPANHLIGCPPRAACRGTDPDLLINPGAATYLESRTVLGQATRATRPLCCSFSSRVLFMTSLHHDCAQRALRYCRVPLITRMTTPLEPSGSHPGKTGKGVRSEVPQGH